MGLFSAKPGENARMVMEWLGCPCEYFPAGRPVSLIQSSYEDAFAKREIGGYTPVLIVPDDVLVEQLEMTAENEAEGLRSYRERLLKSELPDARNWFTERLTEMKESYGEYWEQITEDSGTPGGRIDKLTGFIDNGNKRSLEVILAKIPTDKPWEVFAWVPIGGWNECPEPEVMMSVARSWYERFHAFPAVITHDILEFAAVPVPDRSAAVGLALEQYAFCNDIIDQGMQEVCVLADTLTQSSVWFFWWD